MVVGEHAVKAAQNAIRTTNWEYGITDADMAKALTAALPFLPVQWTVKKLEWRTVVENGRDIQSFSPLGKYVISIDDAPAGGTHYLWTAGQSDSSDYHSSYQNMFEAKAAAQADYESRILSALEPSAARELALEEGFRNGTEAAAKLIECGCKAMLHGKGECQSPGNCSLEDAAAIRALSSPDHADAVRERAWYFSAGDTVPEWLEKIEKGNCTLTFGVDVVVTSKDGGYEVRPQGIADNAGPILHVVSHGNVTPEIKGGGNGVAIIGYNRPYDETAEGKIERLKRLLEMALPYVECYDTREHNAEQDAVLTEIDKALSVLTEGDHIDDAGKVEGDGWHVEYEVYSEDEWQAASTDLDGALDYAVMYAADGFKNITVQEVRRRTLPSAPASEGAE